MKAVLVFCEGRHDIVFIQRSLGVLGKTRWVNSPLMKLPAPFGRTQGSIKVGFIEQRLRNRNLNELNLQAALHPPSPNFEAVLMTEEKETLFLLLRAHGKDHRDDIVDMLETLDEVFDATPEIEREVKEYAAAFILDADKEGVSATLSAFRERFEKHFGDLRQMDHGKWVETIRVPLGCFVFHDEKTKEGTLEDHLGPMIESAWPIRMQKAAEFIDDNRLSDDQVSKKRAEKWKAMITAAGQFNHPGDPMSVIISRIGVPDTPFAESAIGKALVDFLQSVPWSK